MSHENKTNAKVIHVEDPYSLVINKGGEAGVKQGDTYLIYGLGPELRDPETNQSLGTLEIVRGRAKVTHVQEKMATLKTAEFEETQSTRKIKRTPSGGLLSLNLGLSTEEIVETPDPITRALDAEIGDLAKLIGSK